MALGGSGRELTKGKFILLSSVEWMLTASRYLCVHGSHLNDLFKHLLSLNPTSICSFNNSATGRAQRASARSLNAVNWVILASDPPVLNEASSSQQMLDSDSFVLPADSDEPSATRSNSGFNLQEGSSSGTGGRPKGLQRDKGKGKEVEPPPVRIKEEPKTVSLYSPEPALSVVSFTCTCPMSKFSLPI
jgi:hypothetical protein